jgi:hypothetical protein
VLCKEYDARSCERRGELSDIIARFFDGDDLVRWMQVRRPTHHRRYKAWFDKAHSAAAGNKPGRGGTKPAPKLEHFEMPPPPVSPLLLARKPLPEPSRVAYKKVSGENGNGRPAPKRGASGRRGGAKEPIGV